MSNELIKTFVLQRHVDVSGTSGCGKVAIGIELQDTKECIVHWLGQHSCTNIYHSIDDVKWIHGHGTATEICWDSDD